MVPRKEGKGRKIMEPMDMDTDITSMLQPADGLPTMNTVTFARKVVTYFAAIDVPPPFIFIASTFKDQLSMYH